MGYLHPQARELAMGREFAQCPYPVCPERQVGSVSGIGPSAGELVEHHRSNKLLVVATEDNFAMIAYELVTFQGLGAARAVVT